MGLGLVSGLYHISSKPKAQSKRLRKVERYHTCCPRGLIHLLPRPCPLPALREAIGPQSPTEITSLPGIVVTSAARSRRLRHLTQAPFCRESKSLGLCTRRSGNMGLPSGSPMPF